MTPRQSRRMDAARKLSLASDLSRVRSSEIGQSARMQARWDDQRGWESGERTSTVSMGTCRKLNDVRNAVDPNSTWPLA